MASSYGLDFTMPIFFIRAISSLASYLAAGRVALIVGLHPWQVCVRQDCLPKSTATLHANQQLHALLARLLELELYRLSVFALVNRLLDEIYARSHNTDDRHKRKPDVSELKILPILIVSQHCHCSMRCTFSLDGYHMCGSQKRQKTLHNSTHQGRQACSPSSWQRFGASTSCSPTSTVSGSRVSVAVGFCNGKLGSAEATIELLSND